MIFNRFNVILFSHSDQYAFQTCISSLADQMMDTVNACIVNQLPSSPINPHNWPVIQGAILSPYDQIKAALEALDAREGDIVMLINGCDWLSSPYVLSNIHNAYLQWDILFTCGQYLHHENGVIGDNTPPPPKLVANRSYRKKKWRCPGLRTFKLELLNAIPHSETDCDHSLIYSMLELAGPRIHFFPHVQLICGDSSPTHFSKLFRRKAKLSILTM